MINGKSVTPDGEGASQTVLSLLWPNKAYSTPFYHEYT